MSDLLPEIWHNELYSKPLVNNWTTCDRWLATTNGNNNAYTRNKEHQQKLCDSCGIWLCRVRMPQKGRI